MNVRLKGGTTAMNAAAEATTDFTPAIPLFRNGVNVTIEPSLSEAANVTGYILPAFNDEVSPSDSSYASSIMPFSTAKSGYEPEFSSWFLPVALYTGYGNPYCSFFSPIQFKELAALDSSINTFDPIVACRIFAFTERTKNNNSYWVDNFIAALPAKEPGGYPIQRFPALGYKKDKGKHLLNVYSKNSKDENGYRNKLLILSDTAMLQLCNDLKVDAPKWLREPTDPNYPDLLIGDPTNPKQAIMFKSYSKEEGAIKCNCLTFGAQDKAAGAYRCEKAPISEEVLRGRTDLLNLSLYYPPSAEEIARHVLRSYPEVAPLLVAACNRKFDIEGIVEEVVESGAKTKNHIKPENYEKEAPSHDSMPMPPDPMPIPMPMPAPSSPEPAPAPSPATVSYWVTVDGVVMKKTRSEVESLVDRNPELQIMELDHKGGWVRARDLGFGLTFSQKEQEQETALAPAPSPAVFADTGAATLPVSGTQENIVEILEQYKALKLEFEKEGPANQPITVIKKLSSLRKTLQDAGVSV